MKKIGILCNSIFFSEYANKIKNELTSKDIKSELLFSDKLSLNNLKELNFDLIYSRLSGLKWTHEILSQINIYKIPIIPNIEYFRNSQNKYLSSVIANKIGLKTPKTYLISTYPDFFQENLDIVQALNYPFVLKPLYSSLKGEFCFKIKNEKDLKQRLRELFKCHQSGSDFIGTYDYALIQELIEYKKLIRSLVIDGKTIISGFASPENDWKCSVCMNPDIKLYEQTNQNLEDMNEVIFNGFKGEIMVVDVFETETGYFFNECNTACALFNLENISGINCAEKIANYLISKLNI